MSDVPFYQFLESFFSWIYMLLNFLGSFYIVPGISYLTVIVGMISLTMIISIFWKGEKG